MLMILALYVDDILLTGSDLAGIVEIKMYLKRHFVTKDMGCPKYFLGIEIAHQNTLYFFLSESMRWTF